MGCDIHSVGQIKQNGKWITVFKKFGDDSRNYDTFTILAGVRGDEDSEKYFHKGQILKTTGIPNDFEINDDGTHNIALGTKSGSRYDWVKSEEEIQRRQQEDHSEEAIWMGEHSFHSYTAKQLNTYTKAAQKIKIHHVGYFTIESMELILKGQDPNSQCYETNKDECSIILSLEEYLSFKKEKKLPKKDFYVEYEWLETDINNTNIELINQQLQNLVKEYEVSEDDARIVFGFDS